MSITENRIHQAATAIHSHANSQQEMDILRQIVNEEKGHEVVAELISLSRAAGATEYIAFGQALSDLERVAIASPSIGGVLLASLSSIAGKIVGMHDVFDAINLWMEHSVSKELGGELTRLARHEKSAEVRKRVENWIQRMNARMNPP